MQETGIAVEKMKEEDHRIPEGWKTGGMMKEEDNLLPERWKMLGKMMEEEQVQENIGVQETIEEQRVQEEIGAQIEDNKTLTIMTGGKVMIQGEMVQEDQTLPTGWKEVLL